MDRETSERSTTLSLARSVEQKYCDELKAKGRAEMIQKKNRISFRCLFSGTKVKWIFGYVPRCS
jgi:glycerol kinase